MKLISVKNSSKKTKIIVISVAVAVAVAIIALAFWIIGAFSSEDVGNISKAAATDKNDKVVVTDEIPETPDKAILDEAKMLFVSYDYEKALELISSLDTEEATALKAEIEAEVATLAPADNYAIPHIFFHSLIADTSKAFDGDYKEAGYNQVMTTISEFNEILAEMYEKGFVLVSIHDIAGVNEDGTTYEKEILLPPGKKPFVLSVDDVNYYEYMEGDGFASRIVIGEDGKPTCEMKLDDGTITTGDFDVVPLLDAFIEEHPEFSYRGAKGILALTGYEGVLGYRTCPSYSDEPTYAADIESAKAVAQNLKDNGWEFASHSWGHRDMSKMSFENFKIDTNRWEDEVEPIIGTTDVILYPFGSDIGSWKGYKEDNEKFNYLKKVGFNYFCNVDGNRAWLQIGKNYVRQGRRNLDGYKIYYDMINPNKDWLSDLIDVEKVFDKSRPTPVPPM
ncbi:MAG: polysaccharide deacetylase family protein [Oscillospiraceae bacterium]|nr:polysaccharide deacetylase family protein [Oscillospiraceae bacterium]